MGDFFLDLRPKERRQLSKAGEFLRFYPDMRMEVIEKDGFGLVLTSVDDPNLWGYFSEPDGSLLVALCGRVSLEPSQWEQARKVEAQGGLACKFIAQVYNQRGIHGLEQLNGNFAIILHDLGLGKLFLITDRGGFMPVFEYDAVGQMAFSSHPDVLADQTGEGRNWDLTSMAEFILKCKVSFPFTYYRNIKALEYASVLTVNLTGTSSGPISKRKYFCFEPDVAASRTQSELAEELATAFRKAASKRTLPIFGKVALALSGGLDSRMLLCAVPDRSNLITFCCYDDENVEFHTARRIAEKAGVEFVPLRRNFDYYADNAALGARISGGMGCIASNHFLGFRNRLAELGVKNLITGCYCDYLFKGLALDKQINRWTFQKSLGNFSHEYYAHHFSSDTQLGRSVENRLNDLCPPARQQDRSVHGVLTLEQKRIFPLYYEEDNAGRTIPQRVLGWFPPVAENELIDVFLKMSYRHKLNGTVFERMVEQVCGPEISRIPDANTGAPVNAGLFQTMAHGHLHRLKRRMMKRRKSIASAESWPNWDYYVANSRKVEELWSQPNPDAREVFRQVLGPDRFKSNIRDYQGKNLWLFIQMFSLKLWFDQRP